MEKNRMIYADNAVLEEEAWENFVIPDNDFDGMDEYCDESMKNSTLESMEIERIIKDFPSPGRDFAGTENLRKVYPGGIVAAATAYLKRNAIFLGSILFLWLILGVEYSFNAYRVPVFGGILRTFNRPIVGDVLRFFTATYNGPMSIGTFIKPTFYGYLAAFIAKPLYLMGMTGVVIPAVKGIFKKDSRVTAQYKESLRVFTATVKGILIEINHMGLAAAGMGMALILSNLLTRNGKIDKGFVSILLGGAIFAGLKGPAGSLLNIFIRKFVSIFLNIIPNGSRGALYKARLLQTGCITGLGLGLVTGNFSENLNYIIGTVFFAAGALVILFIKEKASYGD